MEQTLIKPIFIVSLLTFALFYKLLKFIPQFWLILSYFIFLGTWWAIFLFYSFCPLSVGPQMLASLYMTQSALVSSRLCT